LFVVVQVVCAIWLPEPEVTSDEIINIEHIPAERWKLRCRLCSKRSCCVQCFQTNCTESFHVSCARDKKWGKLQMIQTPPIQGKQKQKQKFMYKPTLKLLFNFFFV
jgi:hypothetical protein